MNQTEFETMAGKLGVMVAPKRDCSGFEHGRLVSIRYYPETNSLPAMRFACWYDGDTPRKLIRKRIQVPLSLELEWANESHYLAILAANEYCRFLSETDLVPGFVAILSGVTFAYDESAENESALIVQWRDSRDIEES